MDTRLFFAAAQAGQTLPTLIFLFLFLLALLLFLVLLPPALFLFLLALALSILLACWEKRHGRLETI